MLKNPSSLQNREDSGKLVLRVALATLLLFHGGAKLVNGVDGIAGMLSNAGLPGFLANLVYIGEVVAPLMLLLGLWTRAAAAVVVINMLVAIGLVHMSELFTLTQNGGWALELQGFFLTNAIAVSLFGAGRFSLDQLMSKKA